MKISLNSLISNELLSKAMDYSNYRQLIDELMEQGKTTGDNHSEAMIAYTKMNIHRMKRLDKTTKLTEEILETLRQIQEKQIWLVLTEAWCGDAAQIIPVLNKMAETSEQIELKLILRDQHLDLMDYFLTNGGRSIPKLLGIQANNLELIGDWGPRPQEIQNIMDEAKAKPDFDKQEQITAVQLWYAKNKTQAIQKELKEWLEPV